MRFKPKKAENNNPVSLVDDRISQIGLAQTHEGVMWARGEARGILLGLQAAEAISKSDFDALYLRVENAVRLAGAEIERRDSASRSVAAARESSLLIERDFWVDQSRVLQNQVQHWQGMYSTLLSHVERQKALGDNLRASISEVKDALREPVVGTEAVRALTAGLAGNAQGNYTAISTPKRDALRLEKDDGGFGTAAHD